MVKKRIYRIWFVLIFLLSIGCKLEDKGSNHAIPQDKFMISNLPHYIEDNNTVFKVKVRHFFQKPLKFLEITAEAYDGGIPGLIIESGTARQKNIEIGEERLFYIKIRGHKIPEIRFKVTDYEFFE